MSKLQARRFSGPLERIDCVHGCALHCAGKMNVRQAESPDAPVIADFNLRLAEETEQLRLNPARVRAGVAAVLSDPAKGIYFVAEINGVIAGQVMITYEWTDWRNGLIWWLQSVYVRAEWRGRGVFRALFDHLKELARARPDVCTAIVEIVRKPR